MQFLVRISQQPRLVWENRRTQLQISENDEVKLKISVYIFFPELLKLFRTYYDSCQKSHNNLLLYNTGSCKWLSNGGHIFLLSTIQLWFWVTLVCTRLNHAVFTLTVHPVLHRLEKVNVWQQLLLTIRWSLQVPYQPWKTGHKEKEHRDISRFFFLHRQVLTYLPI